MLGDGTVLDRFTTVPAGGSSTLDTASVVLIGNTPASDFSLEIFSPDGVRIVVERPLYFSALGVSGGHCVMGYMR